MASQSDRYSDYGSSDEQQIPQYYNEENKRLHVMVRKQGKDLSNIKKQIHTIEQRHKIITEHAKNVESEQLHLRGLIDVKHKQTESQNHLKQINDRQIGRIGGEMKKLEKQQIDYQERTNDNQVKIHSIGEKSEQLKLELNWNQEELEQWVMVTKQKEEDGVDLERYKKQDQIKINDLSLQIQKLTIEITRKQNDLEREVTQTQTSQIELDKTAEELKKMIDQRDKLIQKLEDVRKNLTRRHQDIESIGTKTAQVKAQITSQTEQIQSYKTQLSTSAKENKQLQMKVEFVKHQIAQKKNQNKQMQFQTNSNLQAQVQILKNKLSSNATELVSKRNKIALLQQQLLTKKERLNNQQKKYSAHQTKLKNQLKLSEKFSGSKNDAEARLKQNQLEKKAIETKINTQKEILVKSSAELFKLKDNEVSLYGQIQGNIAACRNLQSHINKLNQQFQRQQQLLYNAEYQIQLMERKVARAKGQRTLEEKKDLQKEIDEVAKLNLDIKSKHKILNQSVKRLDEDLRGVENSLNAVKQTEKHYTEVIEELTLENQMTGQDLNKISKKKEQVLVQHDIMKLQIKKIKQTLSRATDVVYTLENKKNQMEMSMHEREKEIQVHKDILLAEFKAAEDERHKIAIELAQRMNKVQNLKIKYEALVQKTHGGSNQSVAEHSQAYYVIKAAQEREELQRKGDELSAKIIRAQKQLKSLQCTLVSMKGVNIKIKEKGLRRGIAKQDLDQKQSLEEQLNSASDRLHNLRHQINLDEKEYQDDLRRHTQIRNRVENLDDRRSKRGSELNDIKRNTDAVVKSQTSANRSLQTVMNDPRMKNTPLNSGGAEFAQLQYNIEGEKNKVLFRTLMVLGNEIPQLSAALEESLRARQIELPDNKPSEVEIRSVVSGRSGISQNSQQSNLSHNSRASRQSQNSKQSSNQSGIKRPPSQQSQKSQLSNNSQRSGLGMSGLSGSAIGRVTGISRGPRQN